MNLLFPMPTFLIYVVAICLIFSCAADRNTKTHSQPLLGHRSIELIEVAGLQFKDHNRNGQLDIYEDWRKSAAERSHDLVAKMSLEQKAGFMLISSTRLENDWSFDRPQTEGPISSGFNETDLVMEQNLFTRKPLSYPVMFAAGTTKDVTGYFKRHLILRVNTSPRIIAEWNNNLQALCEKDDLGIPSIVTSNPRNHVSTEVALGLGLGQTPFTTWPGELGLAAMRDMDLVHQFADMARQEWLAVGLRKGYMYMADLATEPRWQRVEGTFGEDAELAAQVIEKIVIGFQGDSLQKHSVALTTKHFPGGGAAEGGQDPHFSWGKREIFEGGMFENNLIPFKAAIDAGTSSIMPYYSYPVHTPYKEVAYAFNREILQDVLRDKLNFSGIINSDTGPIEMMPWGVETLSIQERYKMAIEAGVNIFSGNADPTLLIQTLQKYPQLMSLVDDSVHRLLLEKFKLGLFENPYVDVEAAEEIVGNEVFQQKADTAMRRSIVLLRNEEKALPLKSKTKIYFESYLPRRNAESSSVFMPREDLWDLQFVDDPDDADLNIIWLLPKGKSLFASDGSPLHVNLSANGIDVVHINRLVTSRPTILAVNYSNPWAIDEVYNPAAANIQAVLATFGTTPEAILDIVSGRYTPSAKMPFSTPISDDAAQNQKADVPGYLEGDQYALFDFDEGLDGFE